MRPHANVLQVLVDAGCFVTLRNSKGDDQMAACGQLGEAVFAAATGA
jgi:adenine C2-methylase RlmN of 23S rRNA A2503 and tRNA A37